MTFSMADRWGYWGPRQNPLTSITKRRSLVRSTWRKNLWPIPALAQAPSINPGRSAIVTCRRSGYSSMPRVGFRVVTVVLFNTICNLNTVHEWEREERKTNFARPDKPYPVSQKGRKQEGGTVSIKEKAGKERQWNRGKGPKRSPVTLLESLASA